MKPEEMDRLFSDELEKLDYVPDVEWDDTLAWTKINRTLHGGWNNFTTWIITPVVVIAVLMALYLVPSEKKTQPDSNIPAKKNVIKNNATEQVPEKKAPVFTTKNIKKDTFESPVATLVNLPDTTPTIHFQADSSKSVLRKKYFLSTIPPRNPEFKFSLPRTPVLRLKPDNSLNIKSLIKSIEAQREQGNELNYYYQYNNNYAPLYFPESPPKYRANRNYNITNFNK